jgi:Amt family ammonium transporter
MTKQLSSKGVGRFFFIVLIVIGVLSSFYPANHPDAAIDEVHHGNIAWMLTATALVLLMTPGLSFFYGGMVKAKNIISTMLQSFIALGVVSIIWYVIGFSLCFGESIGGVIGNPFDFVFFDNVGTAPHPRIATAIPFVLFAAFQLKFAIITPALITGSFAERIRFWSYVIFMCLFTLFIYCPIAHWVWHPEGFLYKMGVLDFAGGAVIHLSAGVAALVGALVLGRRKTHVNNENHVASNIPYIILGTGLLWFGWFGFNAGSSLEANDVAINALLNTNMASAAAMICWILLDTINNKKPSALGACIGAVVGLATVTPAAGFIYPAHSILIGIIGSICSYYVVHWKNKSDIDDTLDVFPCHGVGGIVGMILTGVFAKESGLIYGQFNLLFAQSAAVLIIGFYSFVITYIIMKITNAITPLRVSAEEEELGLDLSQHHETVFPEWTFKHMEEHQELTQNKTQLSKKIVN